MNPYEVLGVSEDADMDTIKKAYRDLVKKYHPDRYVNNPLADLASEKLKQINEAYEMIENGRAGSYGGRTSGSAGTAGTGSQRQQNTSSNRSANNAQANFQTVRALIMQNRLNDAEQMLNMLPRTAEWSYLMGVIYNRRGWHDKAASYFQTAVNMEPNNMEYSAAYANYRNAGNQYRQTYTTGGGSTECCNCCTQLMCADCCCECMGGDLITCC